MLLAPTGEAFYSPVATVSTVDSAQGIQKVSFPGCPIPLPPTEGARLYPARSLSLQWDGTTLSFRGGDGASEQVAVQGFAYRYIYTDGAGGEQAQESLQGSSYSANGASWELRYLGLYAVGQSGQTQRSATLRIPILGRAMTTRLCGDSRPSPAGTGAVGIVIRGAPLGDATLSAGRGYQQTTTTSVVYTDVPTGPFTVTARPVSQGLYTWLPHGQSSWTYSGTVNTFSPARVTVDYRLVGGQIEVQGKRDDKPQVQVQSVTLPDGSSPQGFKGHLTWAGDAWSPAQTVEFNERGGQWPVNPGRYELTLDPGWELVSATPTPPLVVPSGGSVSLKLVVRPGPLLLRLSVLNRGRDNGLAPLVCIWPDPGSNLIPPNTEVYECP